MGVVILIPPATEAKIAEPRNVRWPGSASRFAAWRWT